jgi:hypothetical protein
MWSRHGSHDHVGIQAHDRPDRRACLPSIPIPAAAQRLAPPTALAPDQCRDLLGYLAQLADPRQRRGRRHALGAVLAVAVAAVLAGARSLAAIGEWASDAPQPVLAALGCAATRCTGSGGHRPRPPCVGCWPASTRCAGPVHRPVAGRPAATPPRRAWRQAVAVDGKTLRGSGHHGAQVHLLAVMDHTSRAVLGQADVDATNEIARFRPLLDRLDLADTVVTADALSRGRHNASYAEVVVMPRWRAVPLVWG